MIRWLLIVGLLFALGSGLRRGWLQLHWGVMLRDLGMGPALELLPAEEGRAGGDCPPPSGAAAGASPSSRKQAR
jgi:hypothetical protein